MVRLTTLGGLPCKGRESGGWQTGYIVYDIDGSRPTLLAHGGGYGVLIMETKRIKKLGNIYGMGGGNYAGNVYDEDGLCPALLTMCGGGDKQPMVAADGKRRIRKLTPRECWRLMGFSDPDFDKAQAVNSATQLYKQAGNAIVKSLLMAIFSQLHIKGVTPWNEMTDEERQDLIDKGDTNEHQRTCGR